MSSFLFILPEGEPGGLPPVGGLPAMGRRPIEWQHTYAPSGRISVRAYLATVGRTESLRRRVGPLGGTLLRREEV